MRVAIYARTSTGSADQANALEQQLARLRAYAGHGEGDTITEYVDVASGTRDDRPHLQELLQACRSGLIDRVITTRLDRLTRSLAHGAELLTYFSAEDTPSLVALDDALDLDTVGGRMVARILITLAQAETERLSERVNHGKNHQRLAGKPFGPLPPYGYRWNRDRTNYELDPETAPSARRIVQHYIDTGEVHGTLRLAQELPHCKWKSTAGLTTWLLNPSLMGCRCYGRSEVVRDENGKLRKRQRKLGDYATVIPDAHPALITPEERQQILSWHQAHRNRKRAGLHPRFVRELTGLVFCGHCNHGMSYHHGRGGHTALRCTFVGCDAKPKNRVGTHGVEQAIFDALQQHRSAVLVVGMTEKALRNANCPQAEQLRKEIRALERLHDPDLADAISRKQQRLGELIQQHTTTKQMQAKALQSQLDMSAKQFFEHLPQIPEERRKLFTQFVERVVVTGKAVSEVQLRHPIPLLESMA